MTSDGSVSRHGGIGGIRRRHTHPVNESASKFRHLVHASCVAASFGCSTVVLFFATSQGFDNSAPYLTIVALSVGIIAFGHVAFFLAGRAWCPQGSNRFLTAVSLGFGYICLATALYLLCSEHLAMRH